MDAEERVPFLTLTPAPPGEDDIIAPQCNGHFAALTHPTLDADADEEDDLLLRLNRLRAPAPSSNDSTVEDLVKTVDSGAKPTLRFMSVLPMYLASQSGSRQSEEDSFASDALQRRTSGKEHPTTPVAQPPAPYAPGEGPLIARSEAMHALGIPMAVRADAQNPVDEDDVPPWDCGLVCFPLLSWLGCVETSWWLGVDQEQRTLTLLKRRIRGIVQAAQQRCHVLDSTETRLVHAGYATIAEFAEHAALLAFCHNNLEAAYATADGTNERAVSVDRFFARRDEVEACDVHCARVLAAEAGYVTYNTWFAVTEDARYMHKSRLYELADVVRAYRSSKAVTMGVRLCRVLGQTRPSDATLLIQDAHFVSLRDYGQMAACHAQAAAQRKLACQRVLNCADCALSPAILALEQYGPGMAPVSASIATPPDTKPSDRYLSEWDNPRCIHTFETHRVGKAKTYHAVLWFFGGTPDPLAVFLGVAQQLADACNGTVREAVERIHASILTDFEALGGSDILAAGTRTFIRESLKQHQLYSYTSHCVLSSCRKTI